MIAVYVIVAVMLSPVLLNAQTSDTGASEADRRTAAIVEAADRELQQVFVRADLEALEATYADSYTFTDPTGRVSGKREMMASFRSGAIKTTFQEISDIRVQVYGDAAVVTGLLRSRATRDGRDSGGTFRFTRVWVKQNGRWQTVAFQETRPAAQ